MRDPGAETELVLPWTFFPLPEPPEGGFDGIVEAFQDGGLPRPLAVDGDVKFLAGVVLILVGLPLPAGEMLLPAEVVLPVPLLLEVSLTLEILPRLVPSLDPAPGEAVLVGVDDLGGVEVLGGVVVRGRGPPIPPLPAPGLPGELPLPVEIAFFVPGADGGEAPLPTGVLDGVVFTPDPLPLTDVLTCVTVRV